MLSPRRISVLLGATALAVVFSACGSRGPLDADPPREDDAAVDVEAPDASSEATTRDATADAPVDARRDASILGCGICVVQDCQAPITACIQSAPCQRAFQCVLTTCLAGGGGLDTGCLLQCGAQDLQGALQILAVFQCLTGTCGDVCGELLGGIPGLPGGGGGGPPPPRPDAGRARARTPLEEVFSAWPELVSPN